MILCISKSLCFLSKSSDIFLIISDQKILFLYIYQNMTEILKTADGAPHIQTFDLTKSLGSDPTVYLNHHIHHHPHRSLPMHLHLTSIHGDSVRYLKHSHLLETLTHVPWSQTPHQILLPPNPLPCTPYHTHTPHTTPIHPHPQKSYQHMAVLC